MYRIPNGHNNNIFHFLFYTLSGLADLPRGSKFNTDILAPWNLEACKLVYPDYEFVEDASGEHFFGGPYIPELLGGMPDKYYKFLRDSVFRNNPELINNGEPTRCIYITRKNASCRRVLNEPEIPGFEMICLEDYSIKDQIRIFQDAKIVTGPVGAGLSFLIFSHSKTKYINLDFMGYLWFVNIAKYLKLEMFEYRKYILTTSGMHDSDYILEDPDDFCSYLKDIASH
jgi:capsular polysaccharide biosynthesis protein